jgi:phage terminase Nu1 subunit (DNA packaging protein)
VIVTKAEFARRLNVRRSTVTHWSRQGRLVLTDDGRVDLEASIERLRRTERNLGVAIRWREYRARAGKASDVKPLTEVTDYEFWRAMRCHYEALGAELQYGIATGKLLNKAHVDYVLNDVGVTIRVAFETIADRLAPVVAALRDEAEIKATLRREVMRVLHDFEAHVERARHELTCGATG